MPRRIPKQIYVKRTPLIGCGAKRRFTSETEARKTADIQELQDMQLTLFVYKCDFCGFWHLTRSDSSR